MGHRKDIPPRVLEEIDRLDLAESRSLSVLITAQDRLVSEPRPDVDDKVRALGYFQTFVELLVGRIVEAVDELLGKATFLDSISGKRSRIIDRVLELEVELLNASQRGAPVAAYSEYEQTDERSTAMSSGRSAAVNGQAGLTWPVPSAGLSGAVR